MASPVDSARVATNITTAGTSHAISVGSPVANTLLLTLAGFAADPGAYDFVGHTLLKEVIDTDWFTLWARYADGSEGVSDTLTTANSTKVCAVCWEITGAEVPGIIAPEISTGAHFGTAANAMNPDALTLALGSKDYLLLALGGVIGETAVATAAPATYGNLITANTGTGGAAATNCWIAGASRQATTAGPEDPGIFTHATSIAGGTAFTVAIHPAGPPLSQAQLNEPNVYDIISRRAAIRARRF